MGGDIIQSAKNHTQLRLRLIDAFGLEDGEETLKDSLDGISDFKEMAVAALREAKQREAMADAVDAIIAENKARKERHEAAAARIRAAVSEAMIEAGELKLAAPDLSASVRYGKPKLIIDQTSVPDQFIRIEMVQTVDRKAIQDSVDCGFVPDGVQIANPQPILTIRTK